MRSSGRTLYTIGHSRRSAGELIDILHGLGVTRLVDIRGIPRSRTNPQFNLEVLPATLESAGIAYVHLALLGGRRTRSKDIEDAVNAGWEQRPFHDYADYAETAPFREGLRELLEMASRETCAIMCAEAVWWRCHRRIVTDHVLARGVPVVHVFTQQKSQPASLTPFAIIGARARVSYPAPTSRARAEGRRGTDVAFQGSMAHSASSAFRVGDHVSWNSEAGRVRGVIKKKLTAPTRLKGHVVRASEEEPQYVIESDKTDHVAVHKGSALRKLRGATAAHVPHPKQ
jgi:hypothetical protein